MSVSNEPSAPNRSSGPGAETLRIGRWVADPRLDELCAEDTVVKLEPRKMQLLMALARRSGELVTTEELFDTVWKDVVVTQSSVYQSIAQLRKILGDDADHPTYIATVPRKGYRLVAEVSPYRAGRSKAGTTFPSDQEPQSPEVVSVVHAGDVPLTWTRRSWVAAAAASGVALAAGAMLWWRGRPATSGPLRVAVLPFADLSEPPDAAFAAGMTDELQLSLERVPGIEVSARSSSLVLVAQGQHPVAIAQRLGATHFIRGSVRRAAGHVAISAELVRHDSGTVLWSGAFEQSERDSIGLPAQLSRAVVAVLKPPFGKRSPSVASTDNFRALELYFAGTHHLRMATPEAVRTARDYFRRANETDPAFARAYAGLALAWMAGHDFEGLPLREVVRYAQPLVDKALSLEPDSAVAHAVQGYVFLSTLRLKDAEIHLRRASELNPNYATAEFWRGMTAAFDGRPLDAIPIYARAGQLDPMNFLIHLLLGQAMTDVGQFQMAREHIDNARKLAPKHPNGARSQGAVAYAEGNTVEAMARYREAIGLNAARYDLRRELAWLCLDAGQFAEASEAFSSAIKNAPSLPFLIAESGLAGAASADANAFGAAVRKLEQFEPKPLPTGAQAGLAWLYQLQGETDRALRTVEQVAGLIIADPVTLAGPWETFLGQSIHIDIAAIYVAAGKADKAGPVLAGVWNDLERLERNRVVWHSIPFLKARIRSLRGETEDALSDLERATARGFRRGWWLPLDPAFAHLRDNKRLMSFAGRLQEESTARALTPSQPVARPR